MGARCGKPGIVLDVVLVEDWAGSRREGRVGGGASRGGVARVETYGSGGIETGADWRVEARVDAWRIDGLDAVDSVHSVIDVGHVGVARDDTVVEGGVVQPVGERHSLIVLDEIDGPRISELLGRLTVAFAEVLLRVHTIKDLDLWTLAGRRVIDQVPDDSGRRGLVADVLQYLRLVFYLGGIIE